MTLIMEQLSDTAILVNADKLRTILGGFEATNRIYNRVTDRLRIDHDLAAWRRQLGGEEIYDEPTFALNVFHLDEDCNHNALRRPKSEDEWVELVIHQFKSAFYRGGILPKYPFAEIEKKWKV